MAVLAGAVPSLEQLHLVLSTEKNAISYLMEHDALVIRDHCYQCGGGSLSPTSANHKKMRCNNIQCRATFSVFADHPFRNTNIRINNVLRLLLMWLNGGTQTVIMQTVGVNQRTVQRFVKIFQDVIGWDMASLPNEERLIGGEGIIVEIDESKFGKRKYHEGHHVEGVWVVGGVERTAQRRLFAESVHDRSAATLRAIIERCVAPGSIVSTDCWRGYRDEDLAVLGMQHRTVNHSVEFVAADGTSTNAIEWTWNALKWASTPIRHRTRDKVDGHLVTFIWKRRNLGNIWPRFLSALGRYALPDNADDPDD